MSGVHTTQLTSLLFYSFFSRMARPIDVVIVAAVVAILFGGAADAECSNCERRINEWCCETGWRGSCCEFPLQGGLAGLRVQVGKEGGCLIHDM